MTVPTLPPPSNGRNLHVDGARDDVSRVVWMADWKRRRSALVPTPVDATVVIASAAPVLGDTRAEVLRLVRDQGQSPPRPIARTGAQREAVRALLDALRSDH